MNEDGIFAYYGDELVNCLEKISFSDTGGSGWFDREPWDSFVCLAVSLLVLCVWVCVGERC